MGDIFYYQDREEESTIFKYDWKNYQGYIWNYRDKKWAPYAAVDDYVHNQENLRVLSEESVKEEIRKWSYRRKD